MVDKIVKNNAMLYLAVLKLLMIKMCNVSMDGIQSAECGTVGANVYFVSCMFS